MLHLFLVVKETLETDLCELIALAKKMHCVTIVHDITDGSVVWMCERGLKELNISLKRLTSLKPEEYYTRFFNPKDAEDYKPKILGLLERNNDEECVTFFQQVKANQSDQWVWHLSSTRIFKRDDQNQPTLIITQSIPIDTLYTLSQKTEKILEENNFLRKNFQLFSSLSKREVEILKHWAKGESASECGHLLFISSQTVETHRKNVKKKLNTSSFYELTQYARSFDLI